ncbi:response regulator [Herbaspirillum sp. RTI4]|uniref:response regulator transcription factor n=1 Tax=Herbaspirillum sp. RTI4 TaxID=3048640 RepID=UPI002AB5D005|nr:response regulator [Herbaspirillum sp. RTI4]MDY7578274.1 response regulator [Herbaspirillum sp. RTI4]MEA9981233.1 response regulator [Herbaspirillum sp. RTI4]
MNVSIPNTNNLILYVVDDDEAVRKGLVYLLASRSYQVQLFESGEAFLASADLERCGCVILDLRMVGISGLQVFDALRQRNSPLVVLFLSGHGDIGMAVEATKKGAFGWLVKPCDDVTLLDHVAQALQAAAEVAARLPLTRAAQARWQTLTPKEKEVASLVREGPHNKDIALALQSAVRTVEAHRAKVYAKLDVSNPTELDRFMRDHHLGTAE